jgi:hypothetical protein
MTQTTTHTKGTDPRGMTRSTLVRHLRQHVDGVAESKTLKRRVFDDRTEGWKVHWTNSMYADTYVTWENGTQRRSRTEAERTTLRDAALTEIAATLVALGYQVTREPGCLLVLRRHTA